MNDSLTPLKAAAPSEEMKAVNERETRQYWRSVDRLLESPAVAPDALDPTPEFPEGADLPPDAVSRRTMMSLMGASFAMAGLAGCRRPVENILPYVNAPETVIPGVAKYYATTLPMGTDALGLLVESHEGRPTKIEGNPDHPTSQGAATVWAQASILNLYDPDRSPHPVQHGEGAGARTWADFEAFWTTHAATLGDGTGLAVLTRSSASPTLARLQTAFKERYPGARWVVSDAVGDTNVLCGTEKATGGAHRPVYHLDRASVVLALDADLLHTEGDAVRNAKGFAASKNAEDGSMCRLYVAEPAWTATGSAADHRVVLKRSEVPGFAAALARELGVAAPVAGSPAAGAPATQAPEHLRGKLAAIAADLKAAGSGALVVAGRAQAPGVHAVALAINQALGAVGNTVTLHDLGATSYGKYEEFAALSDALDAGEVHTLVVLGGNPAYDSRLEKAISKVACSIHLSTHLDETSQVCTWHLNGTHFLEAWGDAQAADGTLSVVQPLIAPLFGGRSEIELLSLLTTGAHAPGHDLVRETWNALVPDDKTWRRVLHDGLLKDSGSVADATVGDVSGVDYPAAPDAEATGLEVLFDASRSAWDGTFANNAWMQELPDSVTKITWDNAALVSPATAEEMEWTNGDVVLLTLNNGKVEAPVFIVPGQAYGTVALELGFGRAAAGRVGDGVGYNAYRVRSATDPWVGRTLEVKKTHRWHELVQTQEHWDMEGRHHVQETTFGEYQADPKAFQAKITKHKLPKEKSHQLFEYVDYSTGNQWGMAIDLNTCIGCNACIVACQSENNIPVVGKEQVARGREMYWLRVDRYFVTEHHGNGGHGNGDGGHDEHAEMDHAAMGHDAGHGEPGHSHGAMDLDAPGMVFQPIPCMHCENAPCEQVCPVAATAHDAEGLNHMVYNRCIGTRYCSNNCPYKVRRFNFFNYTKDTPELAKAANNPDVTVRSRGVMEKCSYCVQRLSEAKIEAKKKDPNYGIVADGAVQTACQQTCPTGAISFGVITDAASAVSKDKAKDRSYTVLDELNNWPRTSFLARVRNPNSEWESA